MEREKSLSKVKIIPQIYEGPTGKEMGKQPRLACPTCLCSKSESPCIFNAFSLEFERKFRPQVLPKIVKSR